jgi:CubicO group peptidase (beta-lactamase class C family)
MRQRRCARGPVRSRISLVGPILAFVVVLAAMAAAAVPSDPPRPPVTGAGSPELRSFDEIVPRFLHTWQIPGCALAVVKQGRLILARGYGWADTEERHPVEPDSMFRIASLSKPITAAAVLKLTEEGRLGLDDRAFDHIPSLKRYRAAVHDGRLDLITVRELLLHAGGWDSAASFDPMFRSREIANDLHLPPPADAEAIVRYMLQKPLQFNPGSRFAYSNFGYCVLGRIIENVTGQPYEAWVQNNILRPAGSVGMRIGHTALSARLPAEVHYYSAPGTGLAPSVFGGGGSRLLPWPYGGWSLEAMDSHGGWIASAIDLVRFVDALEGRGSGRPLLRPTTLAQMTARPGSPLWVGSPTWYGLGWQVRPTGNGGANWWHTGSLDGTSSLMVRASNGLTWVALLNSRPAEDNGFGRALDEALWRAVDAVQQWPDGDLFPLFATAE